MTSGDVAAQFFSGPNQDIILHVLAQYVKYELEWRDKS